MSFSTRLAKAILSPWFWLAVLAALLVFLEPTPLEIRVGELSVDQWLQDKFCRGSATWMVDAKNRLGVLLFYSGPKVLLIALSVLVGLCAFAPKRLWQKQGWGDRWFADRRTTLFLVACLALIPLGCNRLKAVSNIYCPYEHTRYGGTAPYVRLWDSYPSEFKRHQVENHERGRGFPAGHASGGFALMGLAMVFRERRWRVAGLLAGIFTGFWMGLYQMFKGAHYLNHTLVTACLAWLGVLLLARLFNPLGRRTEG